MEITTNMWELILVKIVTVQMENISMLPSLMYVKIVLPNALYVELPQLTVLSVLTTIILILWLKDVFWLVLMDTIKEAEHAILALMDVNYAMELDLQLVPNAISHLPIKTTIKLLETIIVLLPVLLGNFKS